MCNIEKGSIVKTLVFVRVGWERKATEVVIRLGKKIERTLTYNLILCFKDDENT